jgi:hypothetical protein
VLLAAATNRGKQKALHIVMAFEPVFFIVEAEQAVERHEEAVMTTNRGMSNSQQTLNSKDRQAPLEIKNA